MQTELAATSRSIPATDSPANRLSTQLGTLPDTFPGAVKPPSRASGAPLPPRGDGTRLGRGQASEPPAPAWQDAPGSPRIVLLCTASHPAPRREAGSPHAGQPTHSDRQVDGEGTAAEAGSPEEQRGAFGVSVLGVRHPCGALSGTSQEQPLPRGHVTPTHTLQGAQRPHREAGTQAERPLAPRGADSGWSPFSPMRELGQNPEEGGPVWDPGR